MKGFRDKILESSRKNDSKIVLALDLWDPYDKRLERAGKVLSAVDERVAAVKLNHHLLLPYGLQGLAPIISHCKRRGLPLIADLKLNDIEATNLNVVDTLSSFGVDGLIANPFVGKAEGLGNVIERIHSLGGGIILLVYMSHEGAKEGFSLVLESGEALYQVFAKRARDWKADGVLVSAKDPSKISETRRIVGKDCLVFSPGVGAQGGDMKSGAGTGADFIIVGRAVTEAPDPYSALRMFLE